MKDIADLPLHKGAENTIEKKYYKIGDEYEQIR